MNQERIRERKGNFTGHEHNHAGQRSHRQRLESAVQKVKDHNNQDGHFRIPSGIIFKLDAIQEMIRRNRVTSHEAGESTYGESNPQTPTEEFLNPSYQAPGAEATEIVSFPQAINTSQKQG